VYAGTRNYFASFCLDHPEGIARFIVAAFSLMRALSSGTYLIDLIVMSR
jgi:hypothetical protein